MQNPSAMPSGTPLEKKCEAGSKGRFDIRNENSGILEIDRLFTRFKDMAEQLDNLIHKVYEAKIKEQSLIAESRQAQMQALQMQINPPFLYNTLDSINWMALMAGNEEVSEMILAFRPAVPQQYEYIWYLCKGEQCG